MNLNEILAQYRMDEENGLVMSIKGWCESYVQNHIIGITADELEERILCEFYQ